MSDREGSRRRFGLLIVVGDVEGLDIEGRSKSGQEMIFNY